YSFAYQLSAESFLDINIAAKLCNDSTAVIANNNAFYSRDSQQAIGYDHRLLGVKLPYSPGQTAGKRLLQRFQLAVDMIFSVKIFSNNLPQSNHKCQNKVDRQHFG